MSLWLPRSSSAVTRTHSLAVARSASLALSRRGSARALPIVLLLRPDSALQRRHESTQPPPSGKASASTHAPSSSSEPSTGAEGKSGPPAPPKQPLATRVWSKVKHEAAHYWNGSKLLVREVRISSRLQWKILQGEPLTRRERRQLKRTTSDLLRLIPFAVFVIVPFMEFLLPVALKLFPNMLPSTFEDKFAAEEKQRKLLRVRLDMANFLQETLRESPLKANAHIVGSDAFKEFFRKLRSTGESPSAQDIISVARLFDDDLTLDNLSRPQLVSMCRYMGINAFGTDNFLRGTIRARLTQLRRDDQLINAEGVDSLSTSELQAACQSRGIRTSGVSPARLREELTTWIDLHLHNRVSGVLLVLGRAFQFDRTPGTDEDGKTSVVRSLESVLSGLPDNLLNEAELEVDSDKASYKQKLEVLQQQEELIEDEEEQEEKEEESRRAKREADERAKREEEARLAQSLLPESELRPEEPKEVSEDDARMTTEQLKELGAALSILSAKSSVLKERSELRALMEENLQAEEDPKSPSGALTKRIRSMLTKIDQQIQAYDERVGNSLQMITCDSQGRISVQDLEKALAVIKHRPDEDVAHKVILKLDVDKDGYVELEHVLGLVREEGLGTLLDDETQSIIGQGKEIMNSKPVSKPRKEDIVQDHE
ncbi:LETM1-domain-containing protein [Punctularia strigosozonata HHB-11173 SS5]|uniref:LETM1-domain-containing protein n=1 Tax=Punctularia strigosozonata (strain HHB-11173) TaxID=741275 RepID=UPI0004417D1C|nr:LETM1-domain-containing protein [Punctularia strigosozonata HHB-11173 SS5]EIN08052.1 LETM1-domain-containing protein [Punctularia strigosozonata HHB-11173 SS5]